MHIIPVAEIKTKYFEDFLDYSEHILFIISCSRFCSVALKMILPLNAV